MKCPIKEDFDIEKAQAGVGTVETKGGEGMSEQPVLHDTSRGGASGR